MEVATQGWSSPPDITGYQDSVLVALSPANTNFDSGPGGNRMLKSRGVLIVGLLLLCARPALADPISFEFAGQDFASEGWATRGNVTKIADGTVIDFTDPLGFPLGSVTTHVADGANQALLSSDSAFTVSMFSDFFGQAVSDSLAAADYTRGSGLKREFTLAANDYVTFNWSFLSGDTISGGDYNDAAFFITNVATQQLVMLSSIVGAGGAIGAVQSGEFRAPELGTYVLGVGIFDKTDETMPSYLTVDNFVIHQATSEQQPPTSVPEPGTLLMLTGGFAAVLTARRYRVN